MKMFLGLCLLFLSICFADAELDSTIGLWTGEVQLDTKDFDKMKLHTPAEKGSKATLEFHKSAEGTLQGDLVLGQTKELWTLSGDSYVWKDSVREVTTKKIDASKIPGWIFSRLPKKALKKFVFYEFSSCKLVNKPQECMPNVDMPKGMESGIWAFAHVGNRYWTNLYYEYSDSKQKRVMELLFTKK